MIPEISNVKGFQDFLPPESLKRQAIKRIVEKYYKLYGFLPVETPIIEFDELMKPSTLPNEQEDEAVSDRFRLKDRAGRNLGLRYEFTFQLAKILKQNPNLKLPFRRYQIGENFRDEPLRAGRTRQFTQCDVDIVGDTSTNADVECISLIVDILKELGVKNFEVRINNRKLIQDIIESVEIKEIKKTMQEIDKLDKIGEDEVKANLRKFADSNSILTLFKILEKDISFFKENAFEGSKEIEELIKKCKALGIEAKLKPNLIRGLGYYTGNIFEICIPEKFSIAGGGRYDKLVGKYLNKDIPAVGISFSLESLMANCPDEISKVEIESVPKILIIPIDKEREAIKLTRSLRKSDISCIMSNEKPGKSLEYANSYSIPFVIFLGDEEIKKGKIKLRDMKTGQESLISEKQLINKFSN